MKRPIAAWPCPKCKGRLVARRDRTSHRPQLCCESCDHREPLPLDQKLRRLGAPELPLFEIEQETIMSVTAQDDQPRVGEYPIPDMHTIEKCSQCGMQIVHITADGCVIALSLATAQTRNGQQFAHRHSCMEARRFGKDWRH